MSNLNKTTMNWKKELKELKLNDIKCKSPGFFELSGGYRMTVKGYTDQTANGLTKAITDYINFKGGLANRINTQGQVRIEKIPLAGGKQMEKLSYTHSTTNKGTADIHAIINGRHVSIEIKIGNDKLSEHQLKEQHRVTRAGGLYFVAKDMPSFIEWYNKITSDAPLYSSAI